MSTNIGDEVNLSLTKIEIGTLSCCNKSSKNLSRKTSTFLAGRQQLLETEETDPNEEIFVVSGQYVLVREKYVSFSRLFYASWTLSSTVTENFCTSKLLMLIWSCQNIGILRQFEYILWATFTFLIGSAKYWMKQLFVIETFFNKNEDSFSIEHLLIILEN